LWVRRGLCAGDGTARLLLRRGQARDRAYLRRHRPVRLPVVSCHEIAAVWVAFFSRWRRCRCCRVQEVPSCPATCGQPELFLDTVVTCQALDGTVVPDAECLDHRKFTSQLSAASKFLKRQCRGQGGRMTCACARRPRRAFILGASRSTAVRASVASLSSPRASHASSRM